MARIEDLEYENSCLRYQIRDLKDKIQELEEENRNLDRELDKAKWRIRQELEPRVAAEKRSYDRWVTNPERID